MPLLNQVHYFSFWYSHFIVHYAYYYAHCQVRGFWLDIRIGPFIPFGVDCDKPNKAAEDLFLIHNKVNHYHFTVEHQCYQSLRSSSDH
jgi:Domain of unknown function (DUF4471)